MWRGCGTPRCLRTHQACGEQGDPGDYAASGISSAFLSRSGYQHVKIPANSPSLIGSRALSQLRPDSIGIIWLLKSPWSNLMNHLHLIPYLQDDQKAADYLRQLRWPTGVTCPRCGSEAVEPRERCDNGLQRFNCVYCAVRLGQQCAMCTDWTKSIFKESKLRPLEGFVKLLRLRRSSGKRVPLPGPPHPLSGPLRTCDIGPTRESLPQLCAVLRR